MKEPIRPGRETSVKSCAVEYLNPTLGSLVAAMLQTSHTENPRFSARIDQMRLRRAIDLPLFSQNSASSGFHSLIHLDMSSPGQGYPALRISNARAAQLAEGSAQCAEVNRYGLVGFCEALLQ